MRRLYPWLNCREFNFMFFDTTPLGRILLISSLEEKLEKLDEYLSVSDVRVSDIAQISRQTKDSAVLTHIWNQYKPEFSIFVKTLNVVQILQLDYLSDADKLVFIRLSECQGISYRIIWSDCLRRSQSIKLASYILHETPFKVPKNSLQSMFRCNHRPKVEFVKLLLADPRIDPMPALEWSNELAPLVKAHNLYDSNY